MTRRQEEEIKSMEQILSDGSSSRGGNVIEELIFIIRAGGDLLYICTETLNLLYNFPYCQ